MASVPTGESYTMCMSTCEGAPMLCTLQQQAGHLWQSRRRMWPYCAVYELADLEGEDKPVLTEVHSAGAM